jgi:hypothetical protein
MLGDVRSGGGGMIEVRRTGDGDLLEVEVVVRERQGETRHQVADPKGLVRERLPL